MQIYPDWAYSPPRPTAGNLEILGQLYTSPYIVAKTTALARAMVWGRVHGRVGVGVLNHVKIRSTLAASKAGQRRMSFLLAGIRGRSQRTIWGVKTGLDSIHEERIRNDFCRKPMSER